MKRFSMHMLVCLLVLLISVMFVTAKVAQATSTTSESWRIVKSPNMGSNNNVVSALSGVSTSDVWATGWFTVPGTQTSNGLTQHWDGSRWSIVPNPNPGTRSFFIRAVSAVSTNDVWNVGFSSDKNGNNNKTLTEHWNGSQWSIVPSPNTGTQNNFLFGVEAISTNNVWAVGLGISSSGGSAQILHWNGTQWNEIPSPKPNGAAFYYLLEARAVSANDIWSVGNVANNNGLFHTLIEHWNGKQWSVVSSPNVGSHNNGLNSVTTVSTNDVWVVGSFTNNSNNQRTLILHWNGKQWSVVSSPNAGSSTNSLEEVGAASANDIWAVGLFINNNNVSSTLIQHWDGSKWKIVPSPNFDLGDNLLRGLTVISTNDVWAVGTYNNSGNISRTLIQHCC